MEPIKTRTPQEIWETALGELQLQVSKPNYRTWFSKTIGLRYEDKQFTIGVPSAFAAEYLEKNQRSLIEKTLIGFTSPDVQVVFQVNGKHHNHQATGANEPGMSEPPPTYTRLNPDYVFDAFIEGDCNRLALAAAIGVAQNPGHSYNPLFIYGGAGLGKTHLIHAIGHVALSNHLNVICTSAEQFTNEFVSALRDRSSDEFRNKYRSIGMLLIDDIHFISGKEQTEESFFHTFNELHNNKKQIVITSDCPPKSMPLLEERLRSRFEWGLTVDLKPPDFETRLAILESKARRRGSNIGTDVLEFIAKQNQRNIRELEGSLNRVSAFAKLIRTTPTIEIASKALENISSKAGASPAITPDTIIEAVAGSFQLSSADLLGRKRDKETTLARRIAMYVIRQETNSSLAQVGLALGSRDAAAVTTACKKIAEDINHVPYLRRKIREIQRSMHPRSKSRSPHNV